MINLLQLSDLIDITDIVANNNKCVTSLFSTLSSDDYNTYLIDILNTNKDDLTIEYLGNRLDKTLSPLYQRLYDHYYELDETTALSNANGKLITIIENKFLFNWNKLASGFFADYNPINNYDMTEHEEVDNDRSVNTNMTSKTDTNEAQKYAGFNSPTTLPTTTETEGNSDTTTTGLLADNKQVDDNERTLTRSGNIGVTTTAQMLTQEFELRKRTLLDKIFNDIDSILFLDYYK